MRATTAAIRKIPITAMRMGMIVGVSMSGMFSVMTVLTASVVELVGDSVVSTT